MIRVRDAVVLMCLSQGADLHMAQLIPLPLSIFCSSKCKLILPSWFYLSNEGRINILLWYCLVGTYVGLPLGVVGSPGGKWLRVVRG